VAARWRQLDAAKLRAPWPAPPATPDKETPHAPEHPAQPARAGQRYFQAYTPGDDFYVADRHPPDLTTQSARLNARLILLLSNHIGDIAVLREAMHRPHGIFNN
jgi:hypothetical protein